MSNVTVQISSKGDLSKDVHIHIFEKGELIETIIATIEIPHPLGGRCHDHIKITRHKK